MLLFCLPAMAAAQKPGAPPASPPVVETPPVAETTPAPETPPVPETPPPPVADPALKKLDVLFTSDHYGRFFTPDCLGKKPTSFLMAMARRIEELAPTLLPAGGKPLLIGGGNLFSPDALGQYLLEKEDGAKFILSMFQKMGLKATAYGPEDLLAPTEVFERASSVFTAGGISLLATNIECQKAQEAKCRERVKRHLVFEHDGVKIGLLALFPVAHNSRLPKGVAEMIKFTDPAKAYKEARAQLDKEGVHLVFLVSHLDTEMTFPGAVLAFLRGLDVPELAVVFAS
jgi:2',3'-cyclic-nucleotide 2'-phosphodiesterase (5'-nucleotidase family)